MGKKQNWDDKFFEQEVAPERNYLEEWDDMLENDGISVVEQGFMKGCFEANRGDNDVI